MLLSHTYAKSGIQYWLTIMIASLLSLLLTSCASMKHSKKQAEQETQTILSHLHKTYPQDKFTIQRYYNSTPTFPQNTKIFKTRDDYKHARYYVLSQKYQHSFAVYFKWDDAWSKVSIKDDDYTPILVAQAQQQRISELVLPYPFKPVVEVKDDLDNLPEASNIRNVRDARALLDKGADIGMFHTILVTVPNATDEATLQAMAKKIKNHIAHINHKNNKTNKSSDIYFYSDDQIDVSEITLDFSKQPYIRESINGVETYYRIDEPYYRILSNGRVKKGKRFGM